MFPILRRTSPSAPGPRARSPSGSSARARWGPTYRADRLMPDCDRCRRRPDAAAERHRAALSAGHARADIVEAANSCGHRSRDRSGAIAVTTDLDALAGAGRIDVVIDATGNPNVGAQVALATIAAGKHIVMMNVEADVTIGPYLSAKATEAGVVYTLGAGDEPSSTMELVNFLRGLGYPIVAAGKGKNNAFRIDATPDAYVEEATRRNMNPRMLVEFVDGSKTMVEMVALANATGLVPDIPGMHGPSAPLDSLHKVFCPREEGGLLSRKGAVDFTVARGVAPGVFAVELRHPRLRERMNDLQLGEGPYFTFFRPYHLTSLEVPLSAAAAVLHGQSHMRPLATPVAEVGARAKRALAPGRRSMPSANTAIADSIRVARRAMRRRCRSGSPRRRRDAPDPHRRDADLRKLRGRREPRHVRLASRARRARTRGPSRRAPRKPSITQSQRFPFRPGCRESGPLPGRGGGLLPLRIRDAQQVGNARVRLGVHLHETCRDRGLRSAQPSSSSFLRRAIRHPCGAGHLVKGRASLASRPFHGPDVARSRAFSRFSKSRKCSSSLFRRIFLHANRCPLRSKMLSNVSASGPASRRDSRRSRAWPCGRASRPRRISPAAGRGGTCESARPS